jgi:hypothetical protein
MNRTLAMLAIAACLAPGARAQPIGTTTLSGKSVLAVAGCGHARAPFVATVVVAPDGTWSGLTNEGETLDGTWRAKGRSGRKVVLTFTDSTETRFVTTAAEDIVGLCDTTEPITITKVAKKVFTLSLNRPRTRATVVLRYVIRGHEGRHAGAATYRARATGAWTGAG